MNYKFVTDFSQIDLNRHALIEASAGTGKTYTIENLVVRFLKQRADLDLENILLVTFTEKATSEMKVRIYEKLGKELLSDENGEEIKEKIRRTLDAFDFASIYTIHGFCNTVLKEFALENSVLFQNEVINDRPLFMTIVKQQMRKNWRLSFQDNLSDLIKLSGLSDTKEEFISLIVDIARNVYSPECGDRILPAIDNLSFSQIKEKIRLLQLEIKELVQEPVLFSKGFNKLNIHSSTKKKLLNSIILPLEEYLKKVDEKNTDLIKLQELVDKIKNEKSSGKKGIISLVPEKWLKKGKNIEVCPNIEAVVEKFENMSNLLAILTYLLSASAIKQLQKDVALAKQKNGWISYNDMLLHVESVLYSDKSFLLLKKLRQKYKIAFVDEFQDTDPVQWKIFRKIFIDNPEDEYKNVLYLIGDPKQAIYSFRGADIFAYLKAKHEMENLCRKGRAGLYSLATNWRSQPALVNAYNYLFCRKKWFLPDETAGDYEIGYQKVRSAKEKDIVNLCKDSSMRMAFNIVDLTKNNSANLAKINLVKFIVKEIIHLVLKSSIRIMEKNGTSRFLDYGDICILIRGKSDMFELEPELVKNKIPYTFYKKKGLFASDEALYLGIVFQAIMDPASSMNVKKALLTPFFQLDFADLYMYENMPYNHIIRLLLFSWNDYARSRKWSLLFKSLVQDSGLFFREAMSQDFDRKQTNYSQIFEYLEKVAYKKNFDFRQVAAFLESCRKQAIQIDDADIHQIETDDRKVQVMTMHVSKGLQFPVVFIAGGLTQPPDRKYHLYHVYDKSKLPANFHKVIDLSRKTGKDEHEKEKNDENKRLFYVAFTRAMFKLYIPFFSDLSKHNWIGPVSGFISSAINEAFPKENSGKKVLWLDSDIHNNLSEINVTEKKVCDVKDIKGYMLPHDHDYRYRSISIESFSSLCRRKSDGGKHYFRTDRQSYYFADEKSKDVDESDYIAEKEDEKIINFADEIPGGTEIGLMFHDIFEKIAFHKVMEKPDRLLEIPETRDTIINNIEKYRIDKKWTDHICKVISNTLTAPVPAGDTTFFLGGLKAEERIHEKEFYYVANWPELEQMVDSDCKIRNTGDGYVRGFIDLIFRFKEKYYIADWKSNRVDTGYGLKSLCECMDHADYHLQYQLYSDAMLRWLKHSLKDKFDPEHHFGGVFYFFIRGMGQGSYKGIYHVLPEQILKQVR